MKKLILSLLAVGAAVFTATAGSPVEITVHKRNGKVPHNRGIVAYVKSERPAVYSMNADGRIAIPSVEAGQTVAVILRTRTYDFPADGLRTLDITLDRRGDAGAILRNGAPIAENAYTVSTPTSRKTDVRVNNADDISQYASLADYLTGRIAGLVIDGGPGNYQAYLNGQVPIVMIDGVRARSFNAANMMLNTSDIESVTVDRTATIYGMEGMNGVINITTKR